MNKEKLVHSHLEYIVEVINQFFLDHPDRRDIFCDIPGELSMDTLFDETEKHTETHIYFAGDEGGIYEQYDELYLSPKDEDALLKEQIEVQLILWTNSH